MMVLIYDLKKGGTDTHRIKVVNLGIKKGRLTFDVNLVSSP
jgi:hypothetical protein